MTATPFLLIFASGLLAALLLSRTSEGFRSSFWKRFTFVVSLGLLIVLYDDLLQMSFGPWGSYTKSADDTPGW